MDSAILLQLFLVLHLTGLLMIAGLTLADMVAWNYFWKTWTTDPQKGALVMGAMSNFPKYMAAGAVVLILTGIGMMAIVHGVYGEQLWMRIKIAIVLLVIINTAIIARPKVLKLQKLVAGDTQNDNTQQQILAIKPRVKLFHITQLLLFAAIIILSVFKFN